MSKQVEKLDRSMDFVLVFLTVVSAAIFQFATSTPYDVTNQTQVATHAFLLRFSFKSLFLPFLFIIPMWLTVHIVERENRRMLLRLMVWLLSVENMALDGMILIMLGASFKWEPFQYPGYFFTCGLVGGGLSLAGALSFAVLRAYRNAFAKVRGTPAHDFFYEERWKTWTMIGIIIVSLIGLGIMIISLVL